MPYFCKDCKITFAQLWREGETPEEYTRRLRLERQQPCPNCGKLVRRCGCRKQETN